MRMFIYIYMLLYIHKWEKKTKKFFTFGNFRLVLVDETHGFKSMPIQSILSSGASDTCGLN